MAWVVALCLPILTGCGSVSNLNLGKPRNIPPEFQGQKVGVYVHEKAERFHLVSNSTFDVSDLMAYHLENVLPFSTQNALQEIFGLVETKDPGPDVRFRSSDLAGYFEVRIDGARYDFPEANVSNLRAEVQLLVEFKTLQNELVWQQLFEGQGTGYADANQKLTEFGRGSSQALEDAFQDAIDQMQDGILASERLKLHFRDRQPQP
ncbi:MAG: hypothetical protein HY447_02390 [Candidatus Omnitrophica bacterium]|nr:hypothetical protein [Candidatus Omnitrophota bacterium]